MTSTSTMSRTVGDLTDLTGVTIVADWAEHIEIPVLTGLQRQGDVIIIPSLRAKAATTAVPKTGTPVVRGESGGNTHAIYADGDVCVNVRTPQAGQLLAAVITVGEGATAWLGHPEHGYLGIGPGTYEARRQREQADVIRMVAD